MLHIINNLGSGGAEKLIEESLPLMNKADNISVDLLLLTDKNNVFDKKLKENGIKIDVLALRKPYNPLNIIQIRNYITKRNYDIIHVHLFPAQYWVALASKLIFKDKPKFVTTEHSTHNRRREKLYFKIIDKFIYSIYDRIVSISEKTQENLISWIRPRKKNLEKYQVIKNGINLNKFQLAKPYLKSEIHHDFSDNEKLVCMVGRFSEHKDQATLIKAIKKLPENIHLLLIGEGPSKHNNKNLAKELGIEKRIHFLDFRNDVDRILKTVDIVVLSSNWEGLSLASIEGMASGKPFVASNVPGLYEIVEGSGILFPKGDFEILAKIIYELILDEEKCNKVSNDCLSKAANYGIEKSIGKYESLYNEMML